MLQELEINLQMRYPAYERPVQTKSIENYIPVSIVNTNTTVIIKVRLENI